MTLRLLASCGFLVVFLATEEVVGQSHGFHHVPGTVLQYTGHGFGAGHHAPMIRIPHWHVPRTQRYVTIPVCEVCAALPMRAFPQSSGPGCHTQLDQLLRSDDDELLPVTPTGPVRPTPALPYESAGERPLIPMLP